MFHTATLSYTNTNTNTNTLLSTSIYFLAVS